MISDWNSHTWQCGSCFFIGSAMRSSFHVDLTDQCQGAAKMFMGKRRVFNKPKTKTACRGCKSLVAEVPFSTCWVFPAEWNLMASTYSVDWWLFLLVDIVNTPKMSKTYVYCIRKKFNGWSLNKLPSKIKKCSTIACKANDLCLQIAL